MQQRNKISAALKRAYISVMMYILGRAFQAITEQDAVAREEVKTFPTGFTFAMLVWPNGPGMAVRKVEAGHFEYARLPAGEKASLAIYIKHPQHAFRMLSFQEGTARAFANDRMVVDGELSLAIRAVRVLNRLEAFILPKFIARLAIKEYPGITFGQKLVRGGAIYLSVVKNLLVNPRGA